VHESNARNLFVQLSLSQLAKTLSFLLLLISTPLELKKSTEQVLPGSEGEEKREGGKFLKMK
jgi:hypothetical protein